MSLYSSPSTSAPAKENAVIPLFLLLALMYITSFSFTAFHCGNDAR